MHGDIDNVMTNSRRLTVNYVLSENFGPLYSNVMIMCGVRACSGFYSYHSLGSIPIVFKKHKKQQRRNNNNNDNALSRSCRNNYHNPNHPDSSMVWLSGTSEPFNHTEKTVNGTGM